MEMPGGSGARAAGAGAGFAPRSSADWRVEPSCSAADLELVAAFATNFPAAAIATGGVTAEDSAAALRQVRPYRARTPLGAHGRVWDVHCWALPAAANADAAPVALCMHGHGHSCCVTSWAALFAPLHAAGFNVLAVDAPCFGRSGGSACESALMPAPRGGEPTCLVVVVVRHLQQHLCLGMPPIRDLSIRDLVDQGFRVDFSGEAGGVMAMVTHPDRVWTGGEGPGWSPFVDQRIIFCITNV